MELLGRQRRVLVLDKDNRIASVVDEMMWYGDWDVVVTYDPNAVFDKAKACKPKTKQVVDQIKELESYISRIPG